MRYKDYYSILGVPRTASQEEIKRAFRSLARQHHPDSARGDPGAEEKFKEANEAYEVLKDPEKRKKYDALGSGWQDETEFRPPPEWAPRGRSGRGPGFDFNVGGTGFSDFFEAFFGSAGMEEDPFADPGFYQGGRSRQARGGDLEADLMVTLEEAVRGAVRQVSVQRETRSGYPPSVETYQVRIPPGVRQGQRIRLSGKGESGRSGGGAGDLYLRVRLAEHPTFRIEGDDLYCDLDLAPWEAVLGAKVSIPTPTGSAMLTIPAGTSTGKKFRLRGHGMPAVGGQRGDLYAVAQIQIPLETTAEERKLWEELARSSSFRPRP